MHADDRVSMNHYSVILVVLLLCGCDDAQTNSDLRTRLNVLQSKSTLIEVDRERAILGTFRSADAIFVSGGGTGPQSGVIYRFDGMTFAEEETPPGPAIWWLWGNSDGELWACGDGGRILRRTPQNNWVAEQTPLADNTILYGLWGDNEGHLYAVGGSYRRGGEQNIVLTSSGDGIWERVPDLGPPESFSFFKVWGADPMWIVGDLGWTAVIDAEGATYVQSPQKEVLFTVHGSGDQVFAVGGVSSGQIYGLTSGNMVRQQVPGVRSMNGLFVRPDGWTLAGGEGGQFLLGTDNAQWGTGVLFPKQLENRTIHAIHSVSTSIFVGGDMRAMNRGFLILAPAFSDNKGSML